MYTKAAMDISVMYLKKHEVFNGLSEEQLDEISQYGRKHLLSRKKKIGISGLSPNRVYFLVSGKMKTSGYAKTDLHLVKEVLYENDMFGNISLNGFEGEEKAEALINNTLVYCFSINDFKNMLQQHHQLALNYAETLNKKLSFLKEKHAIWASKSVEDRLVFLLKQWSAKEGQYNNGYITLNNYLSLSDFADMLSVSRQFMYTLLHDLKRKELLFYDKHQIVFKKLLLEEKTTD